ncbi:MAG: hypothetical protein K2K33_09385 [Muribaculaceae bacterium]|nr:hypothetical protein [Muribaculaceae bacterium]MDE6610749.1 hypothetical protein [Muribaculaceae bacterium]
MKNTDNTENKKHGCFTPIDKLPDGASVIDPPKDFEPMSGSGGSGSGSSPKIEACKGKEEGDDCFFIGNDNREHSGTCKYYGGPLHCSNLAKDVDNKL